MPKKNRRFETPIQRLDLCDYSDGYIVVKMTIGLLAVPTSEDDKAGADVAFKSSASFRPCVSKINNALIVYP